MTEKELIEGCIKQNREAQRRLYEQFAGKMLVVCNRYAPTSAEAEDILQDAFVKVFEKLHTFRQDCPVGAWIKRIVVNTALNAIRNRPIEEDISKLEYIDSESINEKIILANFHFEELLAMIRKLPKGCQAIFNLYAIEGYQHHEIAEMLDLSEGTSKSQYSRAKMLLQAMIKKEETRFEEAKVEKLRR